VSVVAGLLLGACPVDSGADGDSKPVIILDGGEGEPVAFPLHPTSKLAGAESNDAGMSFFEIEIPAQTAGAPPHRHTHEDEFFYVREGSVTFMADDQRKTIGPGGFILLPRDSWHGVWNAGDEDAILLVGTSEGQFDDFFDAVAMEVAAAGELSPPEVGAIVGRMGAERGVAIDMSMVPDDVRALYGMPEVSED